jgi:anti-sigma regulatory factor (Ser/Thr protein kinase)
MIPDCSMTLRSDPALLCCVRRFIRQYLLDHGVDEEKAGEVVLAIDEACTNAIRHAYDGLKNESYTLTISATREWLTAEVRDHGRTAPPEKVRKRAAAAPQAAELRPGGLGVQLIHRVFDEVSFEAAQPQGNRVLMRLRRAPAEG